MITTHNLGFPRMGIRRELKRALETYWAGETEAKALEQTARELRVRHWEAQAETGVDLIPVGDLALYDHVLDMTCALGVVPARFGWAGGSVDLDTMFRMARGRAPSGQPTDACEMTKWFDTNYHYIVPELERDQSFHLADARLIDQIREAQALGHRAKPVIIGPLTFLWLARPVGADFRRLDLLDNLLSAYEALLERIRETGVEWVQIDEPILCLDLPSEWQAAFRQAYGRLRVAGLNRLLATYFGPLGDHLGLVGELGLEGLHVDVTRGRDPLDAVAAVAGPGQVLSIGIVDGRNVWANDLDASLDLLQPLHEQLGERLWLAPSCSLLHVPIDVRLETDLAPPLAEGLAFALQKLAELDILRKSLDQGRKAMATVLDGSRKAHAWRADADGIVRPEVRERAASVRAEMTERALPHAERVAAQRRHLALPLLPTTTIGSFPQTAEIRAARRDWRAGRISTEAYEARMGEEIADAIRRQEALGLDVLVHGEAERTDMVEYFAEQMDGFAITRHGWVQSYGSRCVKPPIIVGDVARRGPITVGWARHAQSRTDRPVKGMLTGPVTILNWSFVRDDQPREETCIQIALALRDEVADLEAAGIAIIQVDEPALREGLPLRRRDWAAYLDWAVRAFRIASAGVRDETQIHTHMCYSEFNDIMDAIIALDADVISIEAARSDMRLLEAFEALSYPNEIGPGVFDIHSPNRPLAEDIVDRVDRALQNLAPERVWINPDCGLKTRQWPEVEASLAAMVEGAHRLRETLAEDQNRHHPA